MGVDLDLDGARNVEPCRPRLQERRIVNVLLLLIRKMRDAPEDAARDARTQIGAIAERFVAFKGNAGLLCLQVDGTQRLQLGGEHTGEPARAWGKKMFAHGLLQKGLTTTRMTMAINTGKAGISFSQR